MKIETLLTSSEMVDLNALLAQAHQAAAGGFRMFIEARGLVVIGITSGGQLQTWFAAPANSLVEAVMTERVVLAGITAAGLAASAQIATDAIKKAQTLH